MTFLEFFYLSSLFRQKDVCEPGLLKKYLCNEFLIMIYGGYLGQDVKANVACEN